MLCLFRSFRVLAASPASGFPNPLLCLASVCEPDSSFSVPFPEVRARPRKLSLSGRGRHLVAVSHLAHFGVRFPIFRDRWPCASVRDRLTISVCSKFWHTSYLLPFEGHWGLSNPLRARMPHSVLNSPFSGPRTARFGPRTFVLHRFSFIFGRYLCFITRKAVEGWEASNCCSNQVIRPPAPSDARFSHFRANVEYLGATFLNFEPHICDVHTWEDLKKWWPATIST